MYQKKKSVFILKVKSIQKPFGIDFWRGNLVLSWIYINGKFTSFQVVNISSTLIIHLNKPALANYQIELDSCSLNLINFLFSDSWFVVLCDNLSEQVVIK